VAQAPDKGIILILSLSSLSSLFLSPCLVVDVGRSIDHLDFDSLQPCSLSLSLFHSLIFFFFFFFFFFSLLFSLFSLMFFSLSPLFISFHLLFFLFFQLSLSYPFWISSFTLSLSFFLLPSSFFASSSSLLFSSPAPSLGSFSFLSLSFLSLLLLFPTRLTCESRIILSFFSLVSPVS